MRKDDLVLSCGGHGRAIRNAMGPKSKFKKVYSFRKKAQELIAVGWF